VAILTLATVLSQARTLLNDDTAVQFPDPILIPKVQLAHQEMQTALWDSNSPSVRGVSAILTVPANTTSLTPTSTPPLPTDYLTAFKLMESGNNSQAGPWVPMTEQFSIADLQLSNVVPTGTLIYWQNYQDYILLLGSTAQRYIQIQYRRAITLPVVSTDSLGVPYSEQFLSYRAAAMAAGTLGNAEALSVLSAAAAANLTKVISANRGMQVARVKP
jgi:hypothetical protein